MFVCVRERVCVGGFVSMRERECVRVFVCMFVCVRVRKRECLSFGAGRGGGR